MQLRTSKTLVLIPNKSGIICHDYLTKVSIACEVETIYWLSCFSTWSCPKKIASAHPDHDPEDLIQQFSDLQNIGLLQKKGSKEAKRQIQFNQNWKFGLSSAILHFTCKDSKFESLEYSETQQIEKLRVGHQPELFMRNCKVSPAIGFEDSPHIEELLKLMSTRRTIRTAKPKALSRNQLLGSLFAGLGITGFTKTVAGLVPLKMTPSGGARNPFEAFVLVKNVTGMEPGFYHFSAVECNLHRLTVPPKSYSGKSLLGEQDWADDMPAIIFLVAMFDRTMWKYQDDNAYRVVLIEAGHIGQNIALAATAQGLTACPTAALAHTEISELLNLDGLLQNPIYAITLGYAAANPDTIYPNTELPNVLTQCLPNRVLH